LSRRKQRPAFSVDLTERALADLREIESYSVREWGRKTANAYLDGISAALDRLQENPEILRVEPQITPNLFFYWVKKHLLVCDIMATTVRVLAVIHTSMDLPARLLELEAGLGLEAEILRNKSRREQNKT
jgi:plasmid stabilization system protein ParE